MPSAGIFVRLGAGVTLPARGDRLSLTGTLARPHGQLELRIKSGGLQPLGPDTLPTALPTTVPAFGDATEARLVTLEGRLVDGPRRSSTGDLTIWFEGVDGGRFRVRADTSAGIARSLFVRGGRYRLVGILGRYATAGDPGFRIWLRDRADLVRLDAGAPGATPAPGTSPNPGAGGTVAEVAIRAARGSIGRTVTVVGVVTAPATLLDSSRRRIVIQDATGGIEVRLAPTMAVPSVGTRVRVSGEVGIAYGTPRILADSIAVLGKDSVPVPAALGRAPGEELGDRLVRLLVTVLDVKKDGDRWRAEVRVGGDRVPVAGLAGSGIPSTALVEGRTATIVGLVRIANPSATDRRLTIVPRSRADIRLGPVVAGGSGAGAAAGSDSGSGPAGGAADIAPSASASGVPDAWIDADLDGLAPLVGQTVRVGGLVTAISADGFDLDDGTAVGRVVLLGEATAFQALLGSGDAVNVIGRASGPAEAPFVRVSDPGSITRVGSLGEPIPLAEPTPDWADTGAEPTSDVPILVGLALSGAADGGRAGGHESSVGGSTEQGTLALALIMLGLASTGAIGARRWRRNWRSSRRIAARLATIAGMPGPERRA